MQVRWLGVESVDWKLGTWAYGLVREKRICQSQGIFNGC